MPSHVYRSRNAPTVAPTVQQVGTHWIKTTEPIGHWLAIGSSGLEDWLDMLNLGSGSGSGEANTLASRGTGVSLVGTKQGTELGVKSLVAGDNISFDSSNPDEIVISSAGGTGEANTLLSQGGGVSLVGTKEGTQLGLLSLLAGSNVSIENFEGKVKISATGGGGGSSSEISTYKTVFKCDPDVIPPLIVDTAGLGFKPVPYSVTVADNGSGGTASKCLSFNGISSSIKVAGLNAELMGNAISASLKFKSSAASNTNSLALVSQGVTNQYSFQLELQPTTRSIGVRQWASGGNDHRKDLSQQLPLNDGVWHSVYVYMNDSVIKVYVDGVLVINNSAAGTATWHKGSTADIAFGARTDNTNYFSGQLDMLRLHAGELTAAQVAALHAET